MNFQGADHSSKQTAIIVLMDGTISQRFCSRWLVANARTNQRPIVAKLLEAG